MPASRILTAPATCRGPTQGGMRAGNEAPYMRRTMRPESCGRFAPAGANPLAGRALLDVAAAGDLDHGARDETREVARQEQRHVGDLIGCADAAERRFRRALF